MKFTYREAKEKMRANPKKAAEPMDEYEESGQPIFFDIILDISGSMKKFYAVLVACFNEIMIPALKGAGQRYKGPLRVGCLLFSEKLVPAWLGYKKLSQLGAKPLKLSMLEQDGLRGDTALYGAMRSSVIWTAAAMEHMRENGDGEVPKGKIIVLTDGANNLQPKDTGAVLDSLSSINKLDLKNLQRTIGFFNTNHGLTEEEFVTMASKTGFTGLGFYDIAAGGSEEDQQRNFRHHFKIFSSQATQ